MLKDCPREAPVMTEEIFGPILPVYTYKKQEEIIEFIGKYPNPLAFYVFSKNSDFANDLLKKIPSGGACVNECLIHLANKNLPFGGVGHSGIGRYHGLHSFETFSHQRAVLKRTYFPDFPQRYPPYNKIPMNIVKRYFKKLI